MVEAHRNVPRLSLGLKIAAVYLSLSGVADIVMALALPGHKYAELSAMSAATAFKLSLTSVLSLLS
jgi:hypothetical protein